MELERKKRDGRATFRACTYNVHGFRGRDGRRNPAAIVDVLAEICPDVAALQEVRLPDAEIPDFEEAVRTRVGMETLFRPTFSDHRGQFGNVLLSRCSPESIEDHALEIETAGRTVEKRRALFARLPFEMCPLHVGVTHLAFQRRYRHLQAEALVSLVEKSMMPAERPSLFMGDFNEFRPAAPVLTHFNRLFSPPVCGASFPARFPLLPLDRIWASAGLVLHRQWVHRSRAARRASDHLPVCADFYVAAP